MRLTQAVALSTLIFSASASAQTRINTQHAETAAVLQCLLAHGKGCENSFVARAAPRATPWLQWTVQQDFAVGQFLSWQYAGTETANAYTTRLLSGETTDVYDVKYSRRELTFYIVPPGPDGNVRYILIRNGGPDDEVTELWATNPLGKF